MIFVIETSLLLEFPLQTHGNSSAQIHKQETEEIKFDPYIPASTSSSSSCYLPPRSVHQLLSTPPPHSAPQATITSCSDNHNHLLGALTTAVPTTLQSLRHVTARGIFRNTNLIILPPTLLKTLQWLLSIFRMKTIWLSVTDVIFNPVSAHVLPAIISIAATLIVCLPVFFQPLSALHVLSAMGLLHILFLLFGLSSNLQQVISYSSFKC